MRELTLSSEELEKKTALLNEIFSADCIIQSLKESSFSKLTDQKKISYMLSLDNLGTKYDESASSDKLLIELVSSLSSFGKMKRFNVILEIFAWIIPSFIWFFYIFIVESELIAKVSLELLIPIYAFYLIGSAIYFNNLYTRIQIKKQL
ncbi:TPA: hypothetical protein ACOBDN_001561, partial [Enterococcus faecium]